DDAFGCEVARRLSTRSLPEGVRVADFGVAGIHLAYELLGGRYDRLVLVDAAERGEPPATLSVLEPATDDLRPEEGDESNAHDLDPARVLGLVRKLGAVPPRTYVVVCEPVSTEWGMGLSTAVEGAVAGAIDLVAALIAGDTKTNDGAPTAPESEESS